jgi:hypothetical protein
VIYFVSPTKFYILTMPSGDSGNPMIGIGKPKSHCASSNASL